MQGSLEPASVQTFASDIASTAVAAAAKVTSQGSFSGYAGLLKPWVVVSNFTLIADEDNEHRGRPLCKPAALSTLSGYTVCKDVEDNFGGTSIENAKIAAFMQTGFYIE